MRLINTTIPLLLTLIVGCALDSDPWATDCTLVKNEPEIRFAASIAAAYFNVQLKRLEDVSVWACNEKDTALHCKSWDVMGCFDINGPIIILEGSKSQRCHEALHEFGHQAQYAAELDWAGHEPAGFFDVLVHSDVCDFWDSLDFSDRLENNKE